VKLAQKCQVIAAGEGLQIWAIVSCNHLYDIEVATQERKITHKIHYFSYTYFSIRKKEGSLEGNIYPFSAAQ